MLYKKNTDSAANKIRINFPVFSQTGCNQVAKKKKDWMDVFSGKSYLSKNKMKKSIVFDNNSFSAGMEIKNVGMIAFQFPEFVCMQSKGKKCLKESSIKK